MRQRKDATCEWSRSPDLVTRRARITDLASKHTARNRSDATAVCVCVCVAGRTFCGPYRQSRTEGLPFRLQRHRIESQQAPPRSRARPDLLFGARPVRRSKRPRSSGPLREMYGRAQLARSAPHSSSVSSEPRWVSGERRFSVEAAAVVGPGLIVLSVAVAASVFRTRSAKARTDSKRKEIGQQHLLKGKNAQVCVAVCFERA